MADVPDEMKRNGRPEDPHFGLDERLYRRFPPECLEGTKVAFEALELPDMSVNREKLGPPEWLLLDADFEEWGVFAFEVQHIPGEFLHEGVTKFTFGPKHRPHKSNYPHSEVWAYRDGEHIDKKTSDVLLDPDAHQRWRQRLAWKCKVAISPTGSQNHL